MRKINLIVVHCSVKPEGKDFTVNDINRWHRARGFRKLSLDLLPHPSEIDRRGILYQSIIL